MKVFVQGLAHKASASKIQRQWPHAAARRVGGAGMHSIFRKNLNFPPHHIARPARSLPSPIFLRFLNITTVHYVYSPRRPLSSPRIHQSGPFPKFTKTAETPLTSAQYHKPTTHHISRSIASDVDEFFHGKFTFAAARGQFLVVLKQTELILPKLA